MFVWYIHSTGLNTNTFHTVQTYNIFIQILSHHFQNIVLLSIILSSSKSDRCDLNVKNLGKFKGYEYFGIANGVKNESLKSQNLSETVGKVSYLLHNYKKHTLFLLSHILFLHCPYSYVIYKKQIAAYAGLQSVAS